MAELPKDIDPYGGSGLYYFAFPPCSEGEVNT
jgi:hypothetical protein